MDAVKIIDLTSGDNVEAFTYGDSAVTIRDFLEAIHSSQAVKIFDILLESVNNGHIDHKLKEKFITLMFEEICCPD